MRRDQLFDLVRAAARIAASDEVVVIGSQALHALGAAVPAELLAGDGADVFVADRPELGDQLDTALGADSMYHDEHGTHLRAVGPLTPLAPLGWLDRLVPLRDDVGQAVARCMEVHDLVLAKLVVGRGKDLDTAIGLLEGGFVDAGVLAERLDAIPVDDERRGETRQRLERIQPVSERGAP